MKLPGREIGGVQDRSSVDPSVYKQAGEAVGGAFDVGSELAGKMAEHTAEVANRDAILEVTNNGAKLVEDYGYKRSFTPDEVEAMSMDLPESVTTREVVRSDGTRERIPLDEIPAEDVYPEYKLRQGRLEVETQAKTIPGSARRKEFEQRQGALLVEQYGRDQIKAHNSRERKQNTKYENQIANAEAAGSYAVAMQLVREHPILNTEEKDQEVYRLLKAQESRHLFNVRNDGTEAQLQQEIDRLKSDEYGQDKDGDFHNSLEKSERETEISKLESALTARQKDRARGEDQSLGRDWANFYEMVDHPESTEAEALEYLYAMSDKHGMNRGDIAAGRSAISDRGKLNPARQEEYGKLYMASINDPAAFADVPLNQYRPYLDKEDFEDLQSRQQAIMEDKTETQSLNSMKEVGLLALGIDTRPGADSPGAREAGKVSFFNRTLRGIVQGREREKGAPLDPTELQQAVDDAVYSSMQNDKRTNKKGKVGGSWFFGMGKKDLARQGVSPRFIETYAESRATAGLPSLSADEILEEWKSFSDAEKAEYQ